MSDQMAGNDMIEQSIFYPISRIFLLASKSFMFENKYDQISMPSKPTCRVLGDFKATIVAPM
jgi:hypothetical protein